MKIPVPSASLAYRAFFYAAAADRIQPRQGSREISARPIDTRISSSFFRRKKKFLDGVGDEGCATSETRIRGNWLNVGACMIFAEYICRYYIPILMAWILLIKLIDLR